MAAEPLEGGAEVRITPAGNRSAFASVAFRPRVLPEVSSVETTAGRPGARCRLPRSGAPTGLNGLFGEEDDQTLFRAAATAGSPFVQSILSDAAIPHPARSLCPAAPNRGKGTSR